MSNWNLPPGCTTADIDRAMGLDTPCDVCGFFPDDCVCPECEECGMIGDPYCYGPSFDHTLFPGQSGGHDMVLTEEQRYSLAGNRFLWLVEDIQMAQFESNLIRKFGEPE